MTTEDKDKKTTEGQEDEVKIVTNEDLLARVQAGEVDPSDSDEDDEGGSDEEEQRLGASEEDEEEDEKKLKERERRKARKERQRKARERLEAENRYYDTRNLELEKKVQELESRVNSTQTFTLDGRISQVEAAIKKADAVIKDAVDNHRGQDLVEAQNIREGLRDNLKQLKTLKEQQASAPNGRERTDGGSGSGAEQRADPRIISKAQEWHKRNSWFDFGRRDYNSRIAGAIDDALVAEGYDPTTDDYWAELDDRIREALPNVGKAPRQRQRTNGADGADLDEPKGKGGGPKFRGGGQTKGVRKGEFYLSPERVAAMKEAGIWDDPEARAKMVNRYREFDKQHTSQ